jgi:uncharacterized protein YcsI (UPF0317 family)
MTPDSKIITPEDVRMRARSGHHTGITAGLAPGYVQTNLAILPRELAFDFLLFCQRNPKPCPLIEVVEAGLYEPIITAPGSDIRTDAPKYRVFRNGELESEVPDIASYWNNKMVSFLLGCSFTFEAALMNAGIPVRHIDTNTNVPMFVTNIETNPAGSFSGPMVVTMRPIQRNKVVRAIQVSSRFPGVHGAPIHFGDPEIIGISNLAQPDMGDPVEIKDGEVPVFWACGVTPQAVAIQSKPSIMITHSPGHMFVTDLKDEDLAII